MFSLFRRSFSSTVSKLDTLAFIESAGSKIAPGSLSTITAASQIGKPITAVVVGSGGESIVEEVSKIAGIEKVLQVKGPQYDHYLAEELAPLFKEMLSTDKYTHFLTANSSIGKSFLPRVGALIDSQPVSDIIKIEDESTFVRPIYAGNAFATVKSTESIILGSIRSSAFEATQPSDNSAAIEQYNAVETQNRTEFVSEDLSTSDRPELGTASKIIAGGRGLKNKEVFDKLVNPLAEKLNAAIGASRAAVDSGFCDNSLQIGQTGNIVAPDLYIAVGISGAIQHLAGMKDSKTIVAINKDPDAPIFNVADFGLVADLEEAIPELTEKL